MLQVLYRTTTQLALNPVKRFKIGVYQWRTPSRSLYNRGSKVRMVAKLKRNLQTTVEGSYPANEI